MNFKQWLHNLLVAEDDALDALAPNNEPGRTISAHAASARIHGKTWGCVLCKVLDWFEKDHCDKALANDEARAKAVLDDLAR